VILLSCSLCPEYLSLGAISNSTCLCAIVKTILLPNLLSTDPDKTCMFSSQYSSYSPFAIRLTASYFGRDCGSTLSMGPVRSFPTLRHQHTDLTSLDWNSVLAWSAARFLYCDPFLHAPLKLKFSPIYHTDPLHTSMDFRTLHLGFSPRPSLLAKPSTKLLQGPHPRKELWATMTLVISGEL